MFYFVNCICDGGYSASKPVSNQSVVTGLLKTKEVERNSTFDMTLDQDFEAAAEGVKNLTKRPTDAELLELYALFKQGTVGDNDTAKPGMLDLKGKAKWNAWEEKKGMSKEAAKEAYVAYANGLIAKYK